MNPKVAVVGGGAAGLAATYTLLNKGFEVTLFEASDRAGGRMYGEVVDGFYIDSGACIFHESQDTVNRFSKELGISFDRSPKDHVGTVHSKGKSFQMTMERKLSMENIKTLLSFSLFSPREIMQTAKFVRMLKSRSEDLDQKDYTRLLDLDTGENFLEFATRHAGKEFAHSPLVESFFNVAALCKAERMGALQGAVLLWDFVIGNPKQTTRNPEQCVAAFAIALADACDDVTSLSTPVERIVTEDGVAKGVVARGTEGEKFHEADAVICATTASAALRLMPNLPDNISKPLRKVTYSKCCHVAFGVDGNPLPKPSYVFSFIPRTDSFIAAYFDSTGPSPLSAPPGKGVVHGYSVEEHADELFALSDEQIKRKFIQEIRKYAPDMPEETLFTRVHRWEEAVFLAPGGVMTELYELRRQDFPGVSGLVLAGEYMNIMGVNGALQSGVTAADQVANLFPPPL